MFFVQVSTQELIKDTASISKAHAKNLGVGVLRLDGACNGNLDVGSELAIIIL